MAVPASGSGDEEAPIEGASSGSRKVGAEESGLDFDRAFRQLCHVVAITKDGKEALAVDNLLLTTLTVDVDLGKGDSVAVRDGVEAYFGIRLSQRLIEESIDRLLASGRLLGGGNQPLVVLPSARAEVQERAQAATDLEKTVRVEWLAELEQIDSNTTGNGDLLWSALQRFMAQMFRRHGAETVMLLGPAVATANLTGSLVAYMDDAVRTAKIDRRDEPFARQAIRAFFNSTTASRTRYLSQLLDGTFTFFALSVDEATSSFLRESLPRLKVFLDTNFIFGLVGLSDDDQNALSTELIEFIQVNRFPFELYYHEKTLEEIERTLGAIGERLKSQRWSRAMSSAAVQAGSLSTVEMRYHRLNSERGMDADAFLSRYGHVEILLKDFGLKIYREPPEDELSQRRRWLLIADYNEFKKQWRPDRPRRYEALDHDVSVWISVQRLRTPARSALHSGAVFLSNDHGLYRFDWQQKRQAANSGSVVLPPQLLQVLRPFVALNDDFDRRFVQTFSMPEFRTSSTDYTRTASRVLSYMNALQDLPQPTAVAILQSEMLMRRIREKKEGSDDFNREIDLEIIATNKQLAADIERLKAELSSKDRDRMSKPSPDVALPAAGAEAPTPEIAVVARRPLASATTTRVSGLVLGVVLVGVAVGLGLVVSTWEVSALPSEAVSSSPGRLGRALVGALGVLAIAFGSLCLFLGTWRAEPDFLIGAVRHPVAKGALITAVGAALLLVFRLQ